VLDYRAQKRSTIEIKRALLSISRSISWAVEIAILRAVEMEYSA